MLPDHCTKAETFVNKEKMVKHTFRYVDIFEPSYLAGLFS